MTITLDLPRELENELSVEAARLGLTFPDYAVRILAAGRLHGSPLTASCGSIELPQPALVSTLRLSAGQPVSKNKELKC